MRNQSALKSAFYALFAAVICIGSVIRIPFVVVPIVLQNALCILSAVILGGVRGCLPSLIFLAAGFLGFPVYSGGTSGISVWLGPTGGFLAGYFIGALTAGIIAGKPSASEKKITKSYVLKITAAVFAGMCILYVPGALWFMYWAKNAGVSQAVSACILPYIPGDLAKIAAAVPVALKVRPLISLYFRNEKASHK